MKVGHKRAIRGLAIAVLVISVLFIAVAAAGYALMSGLLDLSVGFVSDAVMDMADEVEGLSAYAEPSQGIMNWLLARLFMEGVRPAFLFVLYFLVLSLLVGVMDVLILMRSGNPSRYGNLVIWASVAAVGCVATLRVASLVLLIIVIVFALKDRRRFAQYPAPGTPQLP